jgi:putative tryptophan/tyrosine transport system substrate-binding protein
MSGLKRREFITLLGGAAASPLVARAEERSIPLVAFLNSQSAVPFSHMVAGFRRGLRDAGFLEGQNIAIEYRWAEGQYDRLPALAKDLIHQGPAVLVATGGEPAALAAKKATQAIPIVFLIGGDPVRQGLVATMNRPGGNVTGLTLLTTEIEGKRLGLLQEFVPRARSVAVLINPDFPPAERQRAEVLEAASRVGLRVTTLFAQSDRDFEPAFAAVIEQHADALMVCADPLFNSRRHRLVELAAHYKVPAMYEFREYVLAGGLVSYGVNIVDLYREAAQYTAKILRGAKPSELPVVQPTKFDFVINQKTAKALGLDVPDKMIALADEVIE